MRSLALTVLLCLAAAWPALANRPDEKTASLSREALGPIEWALAQIESGHLRNPDLAKGASGEVSRFQIMPAVWKSYSRSRNYSNPQVAWSVAHRILKDRQNWFISATGREPAPFDLYVMWNKPGLYERLAFNRKRLPRTLADIARRFETLVTGEHVMKLSAR